MKINWYGFDHEGVNKKFTGGLTYCNDFCVNDEYSPCAIYSVKYPDREKDHKDFVLLQNIDKQLWIRGMDTKEMNKWRYQEAITCHKCQDTIYSVNRHDFRHCNCNSVAIDGGRDYTKISGKRDSYTLVIFDLIKNKITKRKVK